MALGATPASGREAGRRSDAFPVPGRRAALRAGRGRRRKSAALFRCLSSSPSLCLSLSLPPLPVSAPRPRPPGQASASASVSASAAMILARGPLAAPDIDGEEDDEDEGEAGRGDMEGAYLRHFAFRRAGEPCPVINGEPCWYCEDDNGSYEDWENYSDEEDKEEEEEGAWNATQGTFCGFKKFFLCKPPSDPPAHSSPACPYMGIVLPQQQQLTAEEAERNAEELVAEEERIKRKAEKKRQKKKAESSHGKDVDDQGAGLPNSVGKPTEASPGRSPSGGTEEEKETAAAKAVGEEELDLSSTFVSKARLKVSAKPLLPKREKATKPDVKEADEKVKLEAPRTGLQMTAVEQSMVLADCGNETAKQGQYQEAVLLFTEAVKLNPREYRFFGNRSFCFERLQCYAEALQDAQLALSLQPGWPKGLFRQGKALMGLKRYAEAARTFEELMRLEAFRGDAAVQLKQCQVHCLMGNSFDGCLPRWNILPRESMPPLPGEQQGRKPVTSSSAQVEGHLASIVVTNSSRNKGLLPSAAQAPARPQLCSHPPDDHKLDRLARKETVSQVVSPPSLAHTLALQLRGGRAGLLVARRPLSFGCRFGPIDSVRRLPKRFCAFINYTRQEAAEAAYAALQGFDMGGGIKLVLQLKHPVHATPPPTKAPGGAQQPLKG
ncbi:hypothetical protein JD844_025973 [Phrynosoma platyrhinos]|uniref:Tetratricopeptide repeat protein 31 n=1 Tax=Phrynosoma platyrhinos TaxID=52577 RepID=A0ABQ7SEC0_PHRPL|nr:hypothetical protein JD844_025973 [Phrynosoma platyrhinos]